MAPAGILWMKLMRHALCGFGATCTPPSALQPP